MGGVGLQVAEGESKVSFFSLKRIEKICIDGLRRDKYSWARKVAQPLEEVVTHKAVRRIERERKNQKKSDGEKTLSLILTNIMKRERRVGGRDAEIM